MIVALITVILVIGIRESANSNNAMVILKIAIILFFVAVGVTLIKPINWTNPATGGFSPNGFAGISTGAAIIFFSYIGFDATSHGRRGGEGPRTRHAVRHHHEPGRLYRALHRARRR